MSPRKAPPASPAVPKPADRLAGNANPASETPWRLAGRLFPEIDRETADVLEGYGCLLRKAMPLRPRHFKDLPGQIKALSQALTSERGVGPPPGYMSDARFLSAYAWYFLPWNLYRLTRLLAGLELELADGAVVLDLGAGPLTFVQALWLARPELRDRNLSFLCLDSSMKTLRLGRELFDLVRGEAPARNPEAVWEVRLVRERLPRAPRLGADLTVAANVLNELSFTRGETLADRMDLVAESLSSTLAPGGRILAVEPGVRVSGKLLARLRQSLGDFGLAPLAPCPHDGACPLDGGRTRTWCHFNAAVASAPQWLGELSSLAGLGKTGVSLSFLLAGPQSGLGAVNGTRVVSNAFHPDGPSGPCARYGCFAGGLGLLRSPAATGIAPGDLLAFEWPAHPETDPKSGALAVRLAPGLARTGAAPATPAPAAARRKKRADCPDFKTAAKSRTEKTAESRPGGEAGRGKAGAPRKGGKPGASGKKTAPARSSGKKAGPAKAGAATIRDKSGRGGSS